ncbi:MAG: dTDP-4-dehydrorhamnose 3,5-epimerase [Bacteroidota bacterium]
MGFTKSETPISDLWLIQPDVFGDSRGFFQELYNHNHFKSLGLGHLNFVQDNLSYSTKGTLRGLHYQAPPFAQGKLICPLQGSVLDVVVDIRTNSATYGKSYSVELHAEEHQMLYVPPGFAHGFQVLSDSCLFFYKCTDTYHPDAEGGLAWDDPALAIPWREIEPVLSKKDLVHPSLRDLASPF